MGHEATDADQGSTHCSEFSVIVNGNVNVNVNVNVRR